MPPTGRRRGTTYSLESLWTASNARPIGFPLLQGLSLIHICAGPNLKWDDARSLRLQNWAHEVNHARELGTVARLLARLGSVETLQNELKRLRGKHSRQQSLFQRLQDGERHARQQSEVLRLLLDESGIDYDQALADLRERQFSRAGRPAQHPG